MFGFESLFIVFTPIDSNPVSLNILNLLSLDHSIQK